MGDNRRRTPESTRNKARLRERQREALELRKAGYNYRTIAARMHISLGTASNYVNNALKEITREAAEDVLTLELERYDELLATLIPKALRGNLAATDRALAIMARIERLHGVESPKAEDGAAETATMLNQLLAASLTRLNAKE